MWAVVNEAGGTAASARLPAGYGQIAGKTGTTQVRRVSREQRERGYNVNAVPREWRPHALFVAYAPYDNPQYAVSVVVEHGTSGSGAAAPLAKDIMVEIFNRFRVAPSGPRMAEGRGG
jgi:penicillin-binding protein 2